MSGVKRIHIVRLNLLSCETHFKGDKGILFNIIHTLPYRSTNARIVQLMQNTFHAKVPTMHD